MSEEGSRRWVWIGAALAVLVALGVGLALLLGETQRAPEGPAEVIWDGDICAHCRMHIGEPAFAAQIQTPDGDVHHFDDPGCLFEYVAEHDPTIAATWFHHLREDRWLPGARTGFVRVEHSPMGYALGAVEAGADADLTLEEARTEVLGVPSLTDNTER